MVNVVKLRANMEAHPDMKKPETMFIITAIENAMSVLHMLNSYVDDGQEVQRASRDSHFSGVGSCIVADCDFTVWWGCEMLGVSRLYTVSMKNKTGGFTAYRSAVTLDRAFDAAASIVSTERLERRESAGVAAEIEAMMKDGIFQITKDENWQFSGFSIPALWWSYRTKDGIEVRIALHHVFKKDIPAVTFDTDAVRQRFDKTTRQVAGRAKAVRTRAERSAVARP